jgi:uncharacterized membrane protein
MSNASRQRGVQSPGRRVLTATLRVLAVALLFPILAAAAAGPAPVAAAAPAPAHTTSFLWSPFLAPFHAVVLHYPIGFLTMAFLLELYALKRPGAELRRIITGVIGLSLLSGLVAAGLGILRASGGDYAGRSLELHRIFGMAIPFLTLLTLGLQMKSGRGPSGTLWALVCYRIALVATLIALVIAGHYGGNLTHGSQYLVQNAPEFIKTFLAEDSEDAAPAGGGTGGDLPTDPVARMYVEKVRPIFESKCISCHSPEKQKGKYRLDQPELALKGGSSGEAAIKPGDPMGSRLVKLITLPREHEDVMPPDGKEPLTAEEILTLVHWIQRGAAFATPAAAAMPGTNGVHSVTNPPAASAR